VLARRDPPDAHEIRKRWSLGGLTGSNGVGLVPAALVAQEVAIATPTLMPREGGRTLRRCYVERTRAFGAVAVTHLRGGATEVQTSCCRGGPLGRWVTITARTWTQASGGVGQRASPLA
jgi:hypothetical protein